MASDAGDTTQTDETAATARLDADTQATERAAAAAKRSAAARKGAQTRARKRAAAAAGSGARKTAAKTGRRTTATATKAKATATNAETAVTARAQAAAATAETRTVRVGDVAERAVLTSVGAALTARDTIVDTVNGLTRTGAEQHLRKARHALEADLRRYERRGASARTSLERDVQRRRARIEDDLRERRDRLARVVTTAPPAPDSVVRNAKAQTDLAAARLSVAVETAQLAGATVVARLSERVAQLV